jgi:hypothetical protein
MHFISAQQAYTNSIVVAGCNPQDWDWDWYSYPLQERQAQSNPLAQPLRQE